MALPTLKMLAERISNSAPTDRMRRLAAFEELKAIRARLGTWAPQDVYSRLDAGILLMQFMNRSKEDVTEADVRVLSELLFSVSELISEVVEESPVLAPPPSEERAPRGEERVLAQCFLLGEILIEAGTVTLDQVAAALLLQFQTKRSMGACLVQQGAVTEDQVAHALVLQKRVLEQSHVEPRKAAIRTTVNCSLGETMLHLKMIDTAQLEQGLRVQRATGSRLGEALVEIGAVTWEQLSNALRVQRLGLQK